MTHQIHLLETLLGVKLFSRDVMPLQLTPEGRTRLPTAEAILVLINGLRRVEPWLSGPHAHACAPRPPVQRKESARGPAASTDATR